MQRAFMMRKVDRTGRLGEFNPLPMVTTLLGLGGEDEDAEDDSPVSEKNVRIKQGRAL